MQKQEFDMEVTEYRARTMLEVLAMLYADQMGMEVKSIKIYSMNKGGNTSTNVFQKAVI